MNVSAVIVTRGDVDLAPILESLPGEYEVIVWDNLAGMYWARDPVLNQRPAYERVRVDDLAVYGRYAAIEHAAGELIYVQDDDVVVSDPAAIVDGWQRIRGKALLGEPDLINHVVCNMPTEFRHDFYEQHALVGFGACFHRDAPARAFDRFWYDHPVFLPAFAETFNRTCDVVFTALSPRVLVDVPIESLPYAHDANRMWKQARHQEERARMLELALRVRDS